MLLTQCPLCEHVNPANSRFCSACGTPLEAMLCPHCGAVNDMTAVSCHKCFGSLLEKKVQALVQARNGGDEASGAAVGNGATHEGPRLPLKPDIASEPTIPESEAETNFSLDRLLVPHLTVPPPSAASMPHQQPPVLDSVFADDEEDVAQETPSSFDDPAEEDTADDFDAPTEVLEKPEHKPIPTVRDEIFGHPQPASWVAEPNGFLRRQRTVVVVGVLALAAAALAAYLVNREAPGDTRAGQPADAAVGAELAAGPARCRLRQRSRPRGAIDRDAPRCHRQGSASGRVGGHDKPACRTCDKGSCGCPACPGPCRSGCGDGPAAADGARRRRAHGRHAPRGRTSTGSEEARGSRQQAGLRSQQGSPRSKLRRRPGTRRQVRRTRTTPGDSLPDFRRAAATTPSGSSGRALHQCGRSARAVHAVRRPNTLSATTDL